MIKQQPKSATIDMGSDGYHNVAHSFSFIGPYMCKGTGFLFIVYCFEGVKIFRLQQVCLCHPYSILPKLYIIEIWCAFIQRKVSIYKNAWLIVNWIICVYVPLSCLRVSPSFHLCQIEVNELVDEYVWHQ